MATQLLKTVKPSGSDYTSLEACMNANEQNLVTADKYFDVEIDGTWSSADTSAVTIHNYTVDATRYINIYTTSTACHNGTAVSGYRLEVTGTCLDTSAVTVTITGIVIKLTTTADFQNGIIMASSTLKKCIIHRGTGNNAWNAGIRVANDFANFKLYNVIVYGFKDYGGHQYNMRLTGDWKTSTILNCTSYYSDSGIEVTGSHATAILKNNICKTGGFYTNDSWDSTCTNNLSTDASAPAVNTYYINKTIDFVDTTAGSEDLHLADTDTDAIDHGADLSGTFTDDIDGVTRSGTWDIGADEYVSAPLAGYTSQVIIIS